MKSAVFASLGVAGLVVGATAVGLAAGAADHLDAPRAAANPALDLNDVYAFQSPQNPDNTVLVMTVNPLAGVMSGTEFDERGAYRFLIDNDGDAKEDVVIPISFGPASSGEGQRMRVRSWGVGDVGESFSLRNGGTAWAGVADDPFFFDLVGFRNGFNFTGDNFFAGANVSAIVLEVPSDVLTDDGDPNIGVWATTASRRSGDGRVDQMGRPAINTVLVPTELKDEFNRTPPHRQFEKFGEIFADRIAALNGGDTATAEALAAILAPDVLTVDVSNPAGFLNGRGLADDVIDAELGLLTNGAVTGDGVANDSAFSDTFPYLAPANSVGS